MCVISERTDRPVLGGRGHVTHAVVVVVSRTCGGGRLIRILRQWPRCGRSLVGEAEICSCEKKNATDQ